MAKPKRAYGDVPRLLAGSRGEGWAASSAPFDRRRGQPAPLRERGVVTDEDELAALEEERRLASRGRHEVEDLPTGNTRR